MKCAWIPVLKSIYNYRAMYMNPIVTTNQKTRIDNKDKKEMNEETHIFLRKAMCCWGRVKDIELELWAVQKLLISLHWGEMKVRTIHTHTHTAEP